MTRSDDRRRAAARALSMYAPDHREKVRRAERRVLRWVTTVHDGLVRTDTDHDVVGETLSTGVRSDVFYLEGLLKLYRREHPWVEPHFAAVKRLEDGLGGCEMWRGLVQTGRKVGLDGAGVRWLEEQREAADAQMREILCSDFARSRDHLATPALGRLVHDLLDHGLEGRKKDRKTVTKEIARRMKKARDIEYDMHQLQGDVGIHELRRQLRWLPISVVALDGLFVFDPDRHPVKSFRGLLDAPVATSPYAQIPVDEDERDPVRLPQSLYLANTEFIDRLGRLKDTGEDIEGMEFALAGAELVPGHDEQRQVALQLLGLPPDGFEQVVAEAQEVATEVIDHDLFGRFAKVVA